MISSNSLFTLADTIENHPQQKKKYFQHVLCFGFAYIEN